MYTISMLPGLLVRKHVIVRTAHQLVSGTVTKGSLTILKRGGDAGVGGAPTPTPLSFRGLSLVTHA